MRGLRIRVKDVPDVLVPGENRGEILTDILMLEDGEVFAAIEDAAG